MSPNFTYSDLLPLGSDATKYRSLGSEGVKSVLMGDETFLSVSPEAITRLTEIAFHDISHYLRAAHLQQLANILKDPESSPNDRFVALDLLKNANISAGGMPDRVKCLHSLVAHSLAVGPGVNPLGDEALAMLPKWWLDSPCGSEEE